MQPRVLQLLEQPTVRKHLSLLGIGFVLGVLVYGFITFEQTPEQLPLLLSGLLGVVLAYLAYYANLPLNAWISWKKFTGLRLLIGTLWQAGSSYFFVLLGIWSYCQVMSVADTDTVFNLDLYVKLGILIFCISLLYNISYFAYYSYNQYATQQWAALRAERKQAELQLAALSAQLSPHFLFNCMNSLSALFHSDSAAAESFIRAMAKSYQYTLENHRAALISVREELAFVRSYSYLLKTRFGEGFQLQVDLTDNQLERKLPPLTLQILVENAVKHNRVVAGTPIVVTINGNDKALSISNNKAPIANTKASTGIGLKNIASRYNLISKSQIKVENNDRFTVTLPLLS